MSLPLFSKEFGKKNHKAKMVRFVLLPGGPVELDGVRYRNLGDRWSDQDYVISNWEVDLDGRLQEIAKEFPNFKIYSFGRSYVYMYFYR